MAGRLFGEIAASGSVMILMLDQSWVSNEFECPVLSLRIGNRALSVLWEIVRTKGAIGFDVQKKFLGKVSALIPDSLPVMLSADRLYGTRP